MDPPLEPSGVYRVHSFHLNINEGDSAIHILVQHVGIGTKDAVSVIKSAVLVDGGRESYADNIPQCWRMINQSLGYEPSHDESPYFDAIVITHWDGDHYRGVIQAIAADARSQIVEYVGKNKKRIPADSKALQKLFDDGIIKMSFIRYDKDDVPTTQIYLPYFTLKDSVVKGSSGTVFATIPRKNTYNATGQRPDDVWTLQPNIRLGKVMVQQAIDVNFTVKGEVVTFWANVTIGILRTGQELVGRDLFTDEMVISPDQAESPQDVANALKAAGQNRPVMFCIAADSYFCDEGNWDDLAVMEWVSSIPDYPGVYLRNIDSGLAAEDEKAGKNGKAIANWMNKTAKERLSAQLITGRTSGNNQSSIACMIIWGEPENNDPANNFTVTHYFGGDVGDLVEERLLRWSTIPVAGTAGARRDPLRISCHKLSHHGSKFSTPIYMLFALDPLFIVGPNGLRKGHNHVSWDTLLLIYVWTFWTYRINGPFKHHRPKLLCTNYPIYLVAYDIYSSNKKDFKVEFVNPGSIASLDPNNTKAEEFQEILDLLLDKTEKKNKLDERLIDLRTKLQVCAFLRSRWQKFSIIPAKEYYTISRKPNFHDSIMTAEGQGVRAIHLYQWKRTGWGGGIRKVGVVTGPKLETSASLNEMKEDLEDDLREDPDMDDGGGNGSGDDDSGGSANNSVERIRIPDGRTQFLVLKPLNDRTIRAITTENSINEPMGAYTNSTVGKLLQMQDDNDGDPDDAEEAGLAEVKSSSDTTTCTDLYLPSKYGRTIWRAGLDEDLCYFVASDAKILKDVANKTTTTVKSNLDLFLGKLRTGAIVFPNKLDIATAWNIIDGSDELYQWLMTIFGSFPDDKSYPLKGKASKTDIVAFNYTTRLSTAFTKRDDPSAKIPACQVPITFSTEFNSYAFGDGTVKLPDWLRLPADKSDTSSTDTIGPGQMLVMSLGASAANDMKDKTFSLKDIVQLFEIKVSKSLQKLLDVSDKVTFNLDSGQGSKNTLWFFPDVDYTTTLRLSFVPSGETAGFLDKILDTLNSVTGAKVGTLEISNIKLIGKKVWTRGWLRSDEFDFTSASEIILLARVKINSSVQGAPKSLVFDAAISLEEKAAGLVVTLDPNNQGMSIPDLLDFLVSMLPVPADISPSNFLPGALDAVKLRRFMFSSRERGTAKSFGVEFQVNWASMTLQCAVKVDLLNGKVSPYFYGGLFPKNNPAQLEARFSFVPFTPSYESWIALPAVPSGDGRLGIMDVGSDIGDTGALYKEITGLDIPTPPINLELIGLQFYASKELLSFSGTVTSSPPKEGAKVPRLRLAACTLDVEYNLSQKELNKFLFVTGIVLSSPSGDRSANFGLQLEKQNAGWLLQGYINGLRGDLLYSLFDDDCNTEIANFLKNITFSINLAYFYGSNGTGSNFAVKGLLGIGKFDLAYSYIHNGDTVTDPNKPRWSFDASLSVTTDTSTLRSILSSLVGDELADGLPDFLGDIVILPSGKTELTSLRIVKRQKYFVVSLRLHLADGASVHFYQIQQNKTGPTDKNVYDAKRIVLFSLDSLPKIPDIPVIGELPQPFDALDFSWVSSSGSSDGFTRAEIDELKLALKADEKPPAYRDNVKPAKRLPEDILIGNGFHFIVKNQQDTIIDYVFGNKKKEVGKTGMELEVAGSGSGDSSYISPLDKKIGPVALTGLGIKFDMKTSTLTLGLNGSVTLGPIELILMGFSISFRFPKGITLKNIASVETSFGLDGLGAALQKPPLTIAGLFLHQKTETVDEYLGAAAIGFEPYIFQAAGYYGEETIKTVYRTKDRTVTSFFTYCRLDGPIATIGVADISGLTAGFGYNTFCTFPNASNVMDFPLIGVPQSSSIVEAMSKLINGNPAWFGRKEHSYWFAAGISGSALETLTLSAVVALEFNPLPKLGIFGVATAEMPKRSQQKLARVQLGIVATLDFGAGVLSIEGQLTPSSFVLDPNCHLTGGFGLFYWFNPRDETLKGQFVFTVGGYHKAFQRPSQFPNPPRLGFNWKFDSAINILGECYFAITPKAVMGGGRLHVSLDVGPLQAWFDAWADFLINYKPFHFMAEGGISVGVRFELDLWFVTITIEVDISATLYLEGPPVAGTVHVDFWVFGFDIDFGNKNSHALAKLTLLEFFRMALQQDTKTPKAFLENGEEVEISEADEPAAHIFSCTSGLIPDNDSPNDTSGTPKPWTVRGAIFAFNVSCKFPFRKGKVITAMSGADDQDYEFETKAQDNIFAKPMGLTMPLEKSNVEIKIELLKPQAQGIDTKDAKLPKWDNVETATSQLPSALWAKYTTAEDPSGGRNNQASLLNSKPDGTKDLTTDIILYAPKSLKSEDKIPRFDIRKASELLAATVEFPPYEDESGNWKPKLPLTSTPWADVKAKWLAPDFGVDAGKTAAAMWANMPVFGWDAGDRWDGAPPVKLVTKLEEMYTEKPSMTAG
ncbi:hypothetical protein TWF506_004137 [Arthrobotrys conoides]|uniref:DUF6603 domain-containing protein n=1 Tax=Arthrobotrys conoides TaxID=74498 RepID=A0AAN8RPQ5_9PEZI